MAVLQCLLLKCLLDMKTNPQRIIEIMFSVTLPKISFDFQFGALVYDDSPSLKKANINDLFKQDDAFLNRSSVLKLYHRVDLIADRT